MLDLFTYEVEISGLANVPCELNEEDDSEKQMTHGSGDGMEYDPSNVEFTKWLALKFYNYIRQWIIIRRMHYGFIGLEEMMKLNSLTKNPYLMDEVLRVAEKSL
ncbi:hypothetical protein Tco_1037296 [Tanacetum coccineum]